jgi:arginine exporter protein ArgO
MNFLGVATLILAVGLTNLFCYHRGYQEACELMLMSINQIMDDDSSSE